ncbi:DUF190 domain-containing protein [Streptomyces sp. A73]|uniref:DUF190 domain-containing protein n=1 Tax=unclassified Streptomyces TaxID=2593676 RepID=UPI000C19993F|nr:MULTISPECIES: DUF190 domain-containing protein [unclassified Streptomyces]MBQ0863003.1 DUF190 domain-containing protein [Streptomyces sp. RK75]MBQ1119385.1 DUF190 domain-containing protein [Streptomyces sp. B15]MBQ1156804.1 DUF190 domain-containing protein [Streptomyces sp. A73]
MRDPARRPAGPQGTALRLTVLLGEGDQYHHRPAYAEIVHRAREAGLAGAGVFRGIEGFGASGLVHTTRLLSLSEDLPVAVVVVDEAPRVRAFLPELEELTRDGLVLLDEVEVVRFPGRDEAADGGPTGGGASGGEAIGGGAGA